jgi:hypothetical protein
MPHYYTQGDLKDGGIHVRPLTRENARRLIATRGTRYTGRPFAGSLRRGWVLGVRNTRHLPYAGNYRRITVYVMRGA